MQKRSCILAMVGISAMSGCASLPAPTGQWAPIPVDLFVNSLKCDYANYMVNYHGRHLPLNGWPVTGTMVLNVAQGIDRKTGAAVSGLVPYQGVSVDFGISSQTARKNTIITTITFDLDPKVSDTLICDKLEKAGIKPGLGFGAWLWGVAGSLDKAYEGAPLFAVGQLDFQTVFSVEQNVNANGSLGLKMIPLSLSASQLATRADVQTISVKMVPNDIVIGFDKKGKPKTRKNKKQFSIGDLMSQQKPADNTIAPKMLVAP
ncbi:MULTISPECIES: hypothetical protein [Mesorhizobium]|uniref:hypothetical protein n=1 Tax=Mesorhizobium TaxID=68287 RepID=UPI0010A95B07|nr:MULTISPECIES: hypothetical protein [Mesorhizobium]